MREWRAKFLALTIWQSAVDENQCHVLIHVLANFVNWGITKCLVAAYVPSRSFHEAFGKARLS